MWKTFLIILIGEIFPDKFGSISPLMILGEVATDNSTERTTTLQETLLMCDPLEAEGTATLCFPPESTSENGNSKSCLEPSVPGTIASYSCIGAENVWYTGFLNCANSGVWITSFFRANNSLCNLDASIVNYEVPDVRIGIDIPEFTTPIPNKTLQQSDTSFLKDFEKLGLQLHNIFRSNHGVPKVKMTAQLNNLAQHLVDSITATGDIEDLESNLKLDPIRRTVNVEMNWYFQIPSSPTPSDAVNNAVHTWYSGFGKYDWDHIERNLEEGDALSFSRVIYKSTQLIGIGVASAHNITFVACVYTPGRNVISKNPVQELQQNVLPFRVGAPA